MGKTASKPARASKSTKGLPGTNVPHAWVPTWEIPVALKGADWAMKGGEKLVNWIVAEGPLSLQVLDSHAKGAKYHLLIRATNLTVHSLYIDSFSLKWPQELDLPIGPKKVKTIGHDLTPSSDTPAESTLIHPGKVLDLEVEFPTPKAIDLEKGVSVFRKAKHLGTGKVHFWILNEEASRDREITFAIRLT